MPVDPPSDLDRILACSWTATPSGIHRLTPDACIDVLRTSGGEIVMCGPERRSWTFELPAGTTAVGVRLRPGIAHAMFGIDVSTIADRRVPLSDLTGRDFCDVLDERLGAAPTLADRRLALVAAIRDLTSTVAVDPIDEMILTEVVRSPRVTRDQIADAVGLSVRALHRRSLQRFGYATSTLGRILRFQRLVTLAAGDGTRRSLAEVAADAGYADQAHLGKDCRAITGLTPTEFLAEYFPTFPDPSDPYKTHPPLVPTLGR